MNRLRGISCRALLGTASTGAIVALLTLPGLTQTRPDAPKIGDPPEAQNMRLVGHNDLQARTAYQPTIFKQGGRYIAYVGHHGGSKENPAPNNALNGQNELNGTSILDVTDPKAPKYLAHIPGAVGDGEAGASQMTRVCDGRTFGKGDPNRVYLLRTFGREGHEIWEVTNPTQPKVLWRHLGMTDTHKNYWECEAGGIAYIVSRPKGWRARIMEVFDLSDPANPVKIRDFGLPGQEPGAKGAVPVTVHGMVSTGAKGNRIYMAYGTNRGGLLQILDREKLLKGPPEPTPDNMRYPEIALMPMTPLVGAHTAMPLGRLKIPGIRQGRRQGRPRIRDDRQRDVPRGMRRSAADGVVRRHHHREIPDGGVELDGAGSEREFLHPGRALRRAFVQRGHGSAVLRKADLHHLLQRRRPRARHPQSLSAQGSRLFHSADQQIDGATLRRDRRQAAL